MLQGIIQSLLGDPIEPLLDRSGKVRRSSYKQVGFDASPIFNSIKPLLQCADQPISPQFRRPQLVDQQAHFLKRLLSRLP